MQDIIKRVVGYRGFPHGFFRTREGTLVRYVLDDAADYPGNPIITWVIVNSNDMECTSYLSGRSIPDANLDSDIVTQACPDPISFKEALLEI